MRGKVNVNDDAGLEKEADVMGTKALNISEQNQSATQLKPISQNYHNVVQRQRQKIVGTFDYSQHEFGTAAYRFSRLCYLVEKTDEVLSQLKQVEAYEEISQKVKAWYENYNNLK
jgi:hypothetical protein